jgi:hypothetical protein
LNRYWIEVDWVLLTKCLKPGSSDVKMLISLSKPVFMIANYHYCYSEAQIEIRASTFYNNNKQYGVNFKQIVNKNEFNTFYYTLQPTAFLNQFKLALKLLLYSPMN